MVLSIGLFHRLEDLTFLKSTLSYWHIPTFFGKHGRAVWGNLIGFW